MKRCGSWIQLPPAFTVCARPNPFFVQLTSSLSCHFLCSVDCGAFWLAPDVTPFGKISDGRLLLPGMTFLNVEYWKTNSLTVERPITRLSFALTELNVFVLVAHDEGAARSPAPFGDEFVSRPTRSAM